MGNLVILIACVLVPSTLFLLAFIVGMIEKHLVAMFENEPAAVPDAYMAAMIRSAADDYGFVWLAAGRHARFATLPAALLRSPDATTLAIIASGTIARIPSKKTILLSRLRDGSALIAVDEAGSAELDPGTRRQILMKADFGELWRAHAAAVADAGGQVLPFPLDATWADVDAVYARRVERMVAARNATYVDASRTRYRYTPAGSFKASIVHGLKQVLTPKNHVRQYKTRPGGGAFASPRQPEHPLAHFASPRVTTPPPLPPQDSGTAR